MADKKTFEQLLQEFRDCKTAPTRFSAATHLFASDPERAKALVPKIKAEQLTLDGIADAASTRWEYAAALVAAQYSHETKKTPLADITYDDITAPTLKKQRHDAQTIYDNARNCGQCRS